MPNVDVEAFVFVFFIRIQYHVFLGEHIILPSFLLVPLAIGLAGVEIIYVLLSSL